MYIGCLYVVAAILIAYRIQLGKRLVKKKEWEYIVQSHLVLVRQKCWMSTCKIAWNWRSGQARVFLVRDFTIVNSKYLNLFRRIVSYIYASDDAFLSHPRIVLAFFFYIVKGYFTHKSFFQHWFVFCKTYRFHWFSGVIYMLNMRIITKKKMQLECSKINNELDGDLVLRHILERSKKNACHNTIDWNSWESFGSREINNNLHR